MEKVILRRTKNKMDLYECSSKDGCPRKAMDHFSSAKVAAVRWDGQNFSCQYPGCVAISCPETTERTLQRKLLETMRGNQK